MVSVSQHSDGFALFYPYRTERTASLIGQLPSIFMQTNEVLVKRQILRMTINKVKKAVGTWSLQVKSDRNYKRILQPGSWCRLHLAAHQLTGKETNQPDGGLKMVGMVKSVRRQEAVDGNGQRHVTYVISGVDHQAIFNTQVYINAQLLNTLPATVLQNMILASSGGLEQVKGQDAVKSNTTPDRLVKAFAEFYLGDAGDDESKRGLVTRRSILIPPALNRALFGSAANRNLFTRMIAYFVQPGLLGVNPVINATSGNVSVWGLMKSQANEVVNEMYTELLPVDVNGTVRLLPSFVLRSLPYCSERRHASDILFLDARTRSPGQLSAGNRVQAQNQKAATFFVSKTIEEHEILYCDLGKTDSERLNFFLVTPNTQTLGIPIDQSQAGLAAAEGLLAAQGRAPGHGFDGLMDPVSAARYGMYPFITSTNFAFDGGNVTQMTAQARDMYGDAYLWENGSVVLPGPDEHIPVGTNVRFQARKWIGHVEGVNYTYAVGPNGSKQYRASLTLVHCMNENGTPIDTEEDQNQSQDGQVAGWDRGVSWNE
jgi:hypothetical protein